MEKRTLIILVVALIVLVPVAFTVSIIYAVNQGLLTISSTVNVGTSVDLQALQTDGATPLSSIVFNAGPGTVAQYLFKVKNVGNVAVVLSLNPINLTGYSLSWDYVGASLAVGASIPIQLSLAVPGDAVPGPHGFNVEIVSSGG